VKPALHVFCSIYNEMRTEAGSEFARPSSHRVLALTVTNMGPGPVILYACIAKAKRVRWWARPDFGTLNPIHNYPLSRNPVSVGPFSAGLPTKIDAGDIKTFYFPYTKECFLREGLTRIGVNDTYQRNTWCRRRDVRKLNKNYLEDFGSQT
jgi:hypothetical protein